MYRLVEVCRTTHEVIGVRWEGSEDECRARKRRIPDTRYYYLAVQAPTGRLMSW